MLKRYLPLLFVLLVVIATAAVFLLFRNQDPPEATATADAPAAATEAASAPEAADGLPEYRVESEAEYLAALESLGTSTGEIEDWARERGFPPATYTELRGEPLEHPYEDMRVPRLRELAEEGDPWAMVFLATRIGPEHTQEAIDLYTGAAVRGSAFAAFKLGNLYREIARWISINHDDRAELLEIAQREDPLAYSSLGWLMVAEYEARLPPGAMSASVAGLGEPDESIDNACRRAAGFLAGLRAERESRGITASAQKPPLAIELPPEQVAGYCDPEVFPRTDFSDCETVRLSGDMGSVKAHRCH